MKLRDSNAVRFAIAIVVRAMHASSPISRMLSANIDADLRRHGYVARNLHPAGCRLKQGGIDDWANEVNSLELWAFSCSR